jgi:Tol biopolymer transport system component
MNADDGANLTRLTFSPFTDWFPSWSPDGTKIAFMSSRDENFEIYVMNADGTNPVNLTNHPGSDEHPSWSPDGTKIAFDSRRGNNGEIYVMNADGTHPVRLTSNRVSDSSPSWSPIFPPFAATSPKEKRLTLWGQIKVLFRKE